MMIRMPFNAKDAVAAFIVSVLAYLNHSLSFSYMKTGIPSLCVYYILKTQSDEIATLRSAIIDKEM